MGGELPPHPLKWVRVIVQLVVAVLVYLRASAVNAFVVRVKYLQDQLGWLMFV